MSSTIAKPPTPTPSSKDNDTPPLLSPDPHHWEAQLQQAVTSIRMTKTRLWNIVLGTAAGLDFWAATVDSHARSYIRVAGWQSYDADAVADWLRNHALQTGMIFSLLWCMDAFVTALAARRQGLLAAEEARYMARQQQPTTTTNTTTHVQWTLALQFCATVTWQLLLLPVGFYILVYSYLQTGSSPDAERAEIQVVAVQGRNYDATSEPVTQKSPHLTGHAHHVSVLMTVLHFLTDESVRRVQRHVVQQGKRSLWRLLRRVLRHPVSAARRLQQITQWLRWIKVVGPLVGTANKLLGNVLNLWKRAQQRGAAQRARRLRRHVWAQMTPDELRHYAATLIQKTYRAMRQRKTYQALQLFRLDRERLAAVKLQALFRRHLVRARLEIAQKVAELQRLAAKHSSEQQQSFVLGRRRHHGKKGDTSSSVMTDTERRRMYQLKAELTSKAKHYVNHKLLLRPNTTFAVAWKLVFCVGVVLELGALVTKTWRPEWSSVQSVLPTPWADLDECQPQLPPGVFQKLLSKVRLGKHTVPVVVPWYCESDAMELQQVGVAMLGMSMHFCIFAVQAVYFLDVFVNFFTGRFDQQTGTLEPFPVFMRWVAPGIVLQLLLNPRMDVVADIVAQTVASIGALGAVRVFRWTVAFFFPVFLVVCQKVSVAWSLLVESQNNEVNRAILAVR